MPPQTSGDKVIEAERTVNCPEPNGGEVVAVFGIEGHDYPGEAATVGQVERVSCSGPHDAEVTGSVELPTGDYPGDDAIADSASGLCPAGVNNFLGPTRETWERLDDREILCLEE